MSPGDNNSFDSVQERTRDGRVEASTAQLQQLTGQLSLRQGVY